MQVTWLSPGTTGLRTVDYRLTDRFMDPLGGSEPYSEKPILLTDTFWLYDPLSDEPVAASLPALTAGHITFGCLNHFAKANQQVFSNCGQGSCPLGRFRLLLLAAQERPGDACLI